MRRNRALRADIASLMYAASNYEADHGPHLQVTVDPTDGVVEALFAADDLPQPLAGKGADAPAALPRSSAS
jgi:hypothetical protein